MTDPKLPPLPNDLTPDAVRITISGPTGSGKSALFGEISLLLKTLGVSYSIEGSFERQMDAETPRHTWQDALAMYRPTVVLVEQNEARTALSTQPPARDVRPVTWTGRKLWLWRNHVEGRPEYWAFDNLYPIFIDCDDPQTLGEPCGYALFKESRDGSDGRTEEEVLQRLALTQRAAAQPPTQDARSCTCHPEDNPPVPCARKYALNECKAAASQDAQDAARYRWLRSRPPGGTYRIEGVIYSAGGEVVDATIDDAMSAVVSRSSHG